MASHSVPLLARLRAELGDPLKVIGFVEAARAGRNNLVHSWKRDDGLEIYFQRNHQPWLVPVLGNTFSGGLSHSGANVIAQMDGRFWFLLSDAEVVEMRAIHDRVVAQLPDPELVPDLYETERSGARETIEWFARPWIRNHEVLFRYRTVEDLNLWLDFLKPLLPELVERYSEKVRTAHHHA